MVCANVCFKKTGTKESINTLLRFVPVFLKQTLESKCTAVVMSLKYLDINQNVISPRYDQIDILLKCFQS